MKKIEEGTEIILEVELASANLARAFARIGNEALEIELWGGGYSDRLLDARTAIEKANLQIADERYQDAQLNSRTILEATLAGVQLGKQEVE